jgi:hypothetical protein
MAAQLGALAHQASACAANARFGLKQDVGGAERGTSRRSTFMAAVPDVAEACRQAQDVLTLVEQPVTARVPSERHSHMLAAMAATARCRALLCSIVHLAEVGRTDTLGLETRALLEVWYFGVITLLGEQVDLDRLEADYRYWKNDLAKKIGQAKESGPSKQFAVWDRAKRANELLSAIGEQPNTAVELYHALFSGESLLNAHASFQSIHRYAFENDDGVVGVVLEPEVDAGHAYGQIRMATVLTALLAKWTYERAGLESGRFDEVDGLGDA